MNIYHLLLCFFVYNRQFIIIFVRMNDMTNIIMIVAGVLTIIGGALEMFAAYTMYKQISA